MAAALSTPLVTFAGPVPVARLSSLPVVLSKSAISPSTDAAGPTTSPRPLPPVTFNAVPASDRFVPSVISSTSPLPLALPRPSSRLAAETSCTLAYVTAPAAMVATCVPMPGPAVMSPVSS